jgi:hypothetical protein
MHDIKLFEPGRPWTTETGHFTYTGVDTARNICLALISVVIFSAAGIILFDSNISHIGSTARIRTRLILSRRLTPFPLNTALALVMTTVSVLCGPTIQMR